MTTTPMIGRVSSTWGKRKSKIPGMTTFHRGVDIAAPIGTDVVAPQAGVVIAASYNLTRGHYVVIDHGGGWSTSSQHLSKRLVLVGQHVAEGQRIGLSGRTGNVTGPHDHTEVRWHGTPIDPTPWYRDRGVTLGVASAVLDAHVTAPAPPPAPAPTAHTEDDDMIQLIERTYRDLCDREGSLDDVAGWYDATRSMTARAFLAAFRASPAEPGTVRAAYRAAGLHEPSADEVAGQLAQHYSIGRMFEVMAAAAAAGAR